MKLGSIADVLHCTLSDEQRAVEIESIAAAHDCTGSSITFIASPKFRDEVAASSAAAVILNKKEADLPGKIMLRVDDPYLGYARVAALFEDRSPRFAGPVHSAAWVDPTASIHATASIGPGALIGERCTIGENSWIGAGCILEPDCHIGANTRVYAGVIICKQTFVGSNVVIQPGAVLGSDGFGNARDGARFVRIPQLGFVIIEDDVEIGANTTIDRGALGPTIIRRGAKLDNLIQIAHNVEVGEDSAIAAQTGVSGSTKIGKRVLIGGQAGFVGHIEIGDDSFVGAKSGVSKDVAPKSKVTGYPARDFMTMRRIEAAQGSILDVIKELKRLRVEVDELRERLSLKG